MAGVELWGGKCLVGVGGAKFLERAEVYLYLSVLRRDVLTSVILCLGGVCSKRLVAYGLKCDRHCRHHT